MTTEGDFLILTCAHSLSLPLSLYVPLSPLLFVLCLRPECLILQINEPPDGGKNTRKKYTGEENIRENFPIPVIAFAMPCASSLLGRNTSTMGRTCTSETYSRSHFNEITLSEWNQTISHSNFEKVVCGGVFTCKIFLL